MRKFESTEHKVSGAGTTERGNWSKILEILPSIVQVLPKILGKNAEVPKKEEQVNADVYYPTSPTPEQYRATQVRNAMDSIMTHKYLVDTLRNNNTISGNCVLSQQTGTSPNNLRHPHYLGQAGAIGNNLSNQQAEE